MIRDTGVVFTLKGDILPMITDYDFNKTHSPDSKQMIIFWVEIHFHTHSKANCFRHGNLMKKYFKKRAILASGLKTLFLSENPKKLCSRLRLLLQEEQAGNNSNITNEEIVAIIYKLLEYKCITPTQLKKLLKN